MNLRWGKIICKKGVKIEEKNMGKNNFVYVYSIFFFCLNVYVYEIIKFVYFYIRGV